MAEQLEIGGLGHSQIVRGRADSRSGGPPRPERWRQIDEALELARAHPEGGTWHGAWSIAGLLAEAGRTEEALAVLEQHPDTNVLLRAELLIDLGRITEAVEILRHRPMPRRNAPADNPWDTPFSVEPPF